MVNTGVANLKIVTKLSIPLISASFLLVLHIKGISTFSQKKGHLFHCIRLYRTTRDTKTSLDEPECGYT